MPIYNYKDTNTEKVVEVIRAFSDYEKVPVREEASNLTDEEFQVAVWERFVGAGIKILRGKNWSGSKGNWLYLLALIGLNYAQNTWI